MQDGFAIVGMACRYPDADDPGQLWENVLAQRRSFRRIPDQRLNRNDYVSDDRDDPDKTYSGKAAVLCGWEFDRHRFRTAGQTFRSADMAHWLALEIAADALADAGFPDGRGLPKASTGVLVGNSLTGEFSRANLMRLRWPYVARVVDSALRDRDWSPQDRGRFLGEIEQTYKSAFPPVVDETLAGGLSNTIAGRICNHFDLHGGGYTIDGACASSLLTVSNACSSLAAEDTDVVLAGGVDLSLDPFELVGFSKLGALASTQMLVFDSRSNGFWPGEGCGFVVLMRQEDAVRQRRRIYAVVRGWGISSDGSGGITRPETEGQLLCLQRAYRRAGYGADSVGYFEGHGTGTPVGDATELRTLSRARCDDGASGVVPAAVGSIKANIGHTKAASGVAGLIKAAMSVDRQLIPPTTGWETPNPVIQQDGNVLQLLHESRTWSADAPIRASVSGMGFGGINAHVTLEGITPRRRSRIRRDEQCLISSMQDCDLFLFAADTRSDLKDQVDHVLGFAARLSQAELGDLAAELSKRLHFGAIRAAITASTPDELEAAAKQLSQWLADEDEPNQLRWDRSLHAMVSGNITPPTIGFLFPGQGFLPSIDGGIWRRRFESVADDYANFDLPQDVDLVETQHAQAAIVAAELAGLRLLSELDVQADVAIGHSLGELSAYHWAGAYDANTLLRLADLRGEVMSDHGRKGGAMASLTASVETVNALIGGNDVAIAGINAPQQTVVSGAVDAVTEAVERAKQQGISATILTVSHAFHSPLMADAEPVFRELLGEFEFSELRGKVLSTISGECLGRDTELRSLLSRQLTSPVRFVDAIRQADDVGLWIEVGPGQILSNLASQSVDVPTVSVDSSGARLRGLLDAVALAFTLGVNVRHQAIFADRFTRPFDLQWAPSFLTNPCEQAPESSTRIESPENVTSKDDRNQHVAAPPEAISPLDCIRDLAAQRAELPLDDVQPDDRLLNDLHLSSIAVGQLVVDATKRLGLSPPSQPTDAANATIADIADYLRQLLEQGSAGAASKKEEVPAGLESWTRQFIVRLEERERRAESATSDHGDWTILSDRDDPFTVSLRQAFSQSAGSGVVVCVPRALGSRQLDMLLAGARRAIQSGSHHRFVLVQRHDDLRSDTGVAPFARSLHLEYPDVTTRVVTIPEPTSDLLRAAKWVADEASGSRGHCEAYYDRSGVRREPVWSVSAERPAKDIPLSPDDVLLVTGGGKGISAECALALARETGLRLALLGRSRVDEDEALRANLKRMQSDGVTLRYCSADVTNAVSVSNAVAEAQAELGPITGVLHGAGMNVPRGLESLDVEAFSRTLAPKVDGLRNVLDAIDPERLRLLVTFGSIISRVGLPGQADYAVANELLAQITATFGREHPHCHALCLEWSVWAGVGMGETLGAVESLRREGIEAISVDEGLRRLKQAVSQFEDSSRIVIAGRFGNPSTIQFADHELPLLRFLERPRAHTPGVELVVDSTLSMRTDPYLRDHTYQGVSLLPAVMGLEAMAQAAMAVTNRQDDRSAVPVEFHDIEFSHPVVVQEEEETEVRVAALAESHDTVKLALRSGETGFQQDHFRARVCLADSPASRAVANFEYDEPLSMDLSKLYGTILFQRGRFQRVQQYLQLDATECVAVIDQYGGEDWYSPYLPQRMLLGDPASRDAILHCIQACIPHGTLIPVAVERLLVRARDEHDIRVHARERCREGDEFVYDIDVTQADGVIIEQWTGLRLRKVSQVEPSVNWPWPLLAPYMQRCLSEKFEGCDVSICLNSGSKHGDRSSDQLIAKTGGRTVVQDEKQTGVGPPLHRRPDGKPEVRNGRSVSASRCRDLTMAVASDRQVACDVELVRDEDRHRWRDLLGREHFELARLISKSATERFQTSATRVWCARECFTKAGLSARDPLTLDDHTPDGWVTLSSGNHRIASWVGPSDGERLEKVFAILLSPTEKVRTCELLSTNT